MVSASFLHLTNPLVTSTQLAKCEDRSGSETSSIHFFQSLLTQSAGVLLRLPQDVIATSLVLLQRYRIANTTFTSTPKAISSAIIYLAAKLSFTPLSPRSVINVYAYLTSPSASPLWFINPKGPSQSSDPREYYVSEGTYEREKQRLFSTETQVLATLGFETHVALPHLSALTYIQALLGEPSPKLSQRVFEHLNGGLLSPQMLYLTHQPNALAVAAIYLASRETGAKLVEENWWEVFDVDREDLGFLVLAFGSLTNFAEAEKEKWRGRVVPLAF